MSRAATSSMLAILRLDLVGYSKLLGSDDETVVRQIEDEMLAVRGILENSGGAIRSRAGDSYLATFSSVRRAFSAAFEIQSRQTGMPTDRPLMFRIGIHVGDVFMTGEEVAGNAVNIAARLEGTADPGGISISRAARDLATPAVRSRFARHGQVQLKNIDEPVEIFRSLPAGVRPATIQEQPALVPKAVVRPRVLVRPFAMLSDDPKTACFATGFTTDLISRLSRFRHLDVIGRASSFALDAQATDNSAAEKVDAEYVTGGQFQIVDRRLRATIILSNAKTDKVLWAEQFNRKIDDFFEVQTEIEELSTSAMTVSIDMAEREAARARDPSSLDAYSLVVNGRLENLIDGATGREATERAMALFRNAATLDPTYSAALAGIAKAHSVQWLLNWTDKLDESQDASKRYALQATLSDPQDANAHASLGFASLYSREHERSLAAYEQAMRLNPSDVEVIAEYADALKHSGEPEKAIPFFERALKLNPLKPDMYLCHLAHTYLVLGQFEDAVATIRQMRQPLTAQRVLTASLMLSGKEEEGRREAAKLRSIDPGFSAKLWCEKVPDRTPEHNAIFQEGLERAGF